MLAQPSSQGYGFSSGHVWMWELDYKESWMPNNWWFWTVVLEKTLESPLNCKKIQPVHPKGDESWVFIGRTDFEAETPILWPLDAKSWLILKDSDAGKDWGQEEKGMTEDETVGWHHGLNGHGFGWTVSWWWTGRPDLLWFRRLQSVGQNWATELNCTELMRTNLGGLKEGEHDISRYSTEKESTDINNSICRFFSAFEVTWPSGNIPVKFSEG